MTAPGYDVGSAAVILVAVVLPLTIMRLRERPLRSALLGSLACWAIGLASLFGRRR